MNRISGSEKGKPGGWYRSIGWIHQSARRLCAYNGRSEASTKRPPGYGKPIADHSIYPEISHLRHGKVIQATCGVAVGGLANFSSRMTAEPQLIREDPSQMEACLMKGAPRNNKDPRPWTGILISYYSLPSFGFVPAAIVLVPFFLPPSLPLVSPDISILRASQPRYYDTTLQPHYEETRRYIAGSLVLGPVNATVV